MAKHRNWPEQRVLYTYMEKKAGLEKTSHREIFASRELLMEALIVRCVDDALCSVDEYTREYIRQRYFVDCPEKLSGIVAELSLSQRTSDRLNTKFLERLAMLLADVGVRY